jgi:hypothetical protein
VPVLRLHRKKKTDDDDFPRSSYAHTRLMQEQPEGMDDGPSKCKTGRLGTHVRMVWPGVIHKLTRRFVPIQRKAEYIHNYDRSWYMWTYTHACTYAMIFTAIS